jgi:hypothetical protein
MNRYLKVTFKEAYRDQPLGKIFFREVTWSIPKPLQLPIGMNANSSSNGGGGSGLYQLYANSVAGELCSGLNLPQLERTLIQNFDNHNPIVTPNFWRVLVGLKRVEVVNFVSPILLIRI